MADKELIKAEIERLKKEKEFCPLPEDDYTAGGYNGYCLALDKVLSFICDLSEEPVSENEYELSKLAVEALDRKRVCPTLKGNALHKFKNEWNTIKQIMHWWDMGKEFLNYRLALHWASWGAQNLQECFDMSEKEKTKIDTEKPISEDLEEAAKIYGRNTFITECMENGRYPDSVPADR